MHDLFRQEFLTIVCHVFLVLVLDSFENSVLCLEVVGGGGGGEGGGGPPAARRRPARGV